MKTCHTTVQVHTHTCDTHYPKPADFPTPVTNLICQHRPQVDCRMDLDVQLWLTENKVQQWDFSRTVATITEGTTIEKAQ
jgi:hypothetical protein